MLSLRRDDVTTTRTAVRITYFNPRLHEGGDGTKKRQLVAICKISIHASAKEATMGTVNKEKFTKISIHASAKEATLRDLCTNSHIIISIHASAKEATRMALFYFLSLLFQSTPPRRRRQINRPLEILIPYFNPRLREGGDLVCLWRIVTP